MPRSPKPGTGGEKMHCPTKKMGFQREPATADRPRWQPPAWVELQPFDMAARISFARTWRRSSIRLSRMPNMAGRGVPDRGSAASCTFTRGG